MSVRFSMMAAAVFATVAFCFSAAQAADTVLAPGTTELESSFQTPPDLYERGYFARKAAAENEAAAARRAGAESQIESLKAARAAAIAADQEAVAARARAAASQPGDYADRINGLKSAPPTGPQTQPPAEDDTTGPQVNPGPGGDPTGDVTGGGGRPPVGGDNDTRSLLDQMMDAVQ